MAASKLIVLADQGPARLVFEGEDLRWNSGTTEWTGYDRLSLVMDDGHSLAFDVARIGGTVPTGAAERGVKRQSRLAVHTAAALNPTGSADTRRLNGDAPLRTSFFWRNPLTPCGAGLWLHLQFRRRNGALRIAAGDVPGETASDPGTRLWFAKVRNPRAGNWTRIDDLLLGDAAAVGGYLPFETFADRAIAYASEELPGPLIDGGSGGNWLVDLRSVKCRYLLGPREAGQEGAQIVSAGLGRDAGSGRIFLANSAAFAGAGPTLLGVQLSADAASLRCIGRVGASAPGESWLLDWTIDPGEPTGRPHALSLPTVWRHLASHYSLGLSATRSRNRFTTVPTRIAGISGPAPALRFELATDAALQPSSLRLGQVSVGASARLALTLGGAQQADGSAPVLDVIASERFASLQAAAANALPLPAELLDFTAAPAPADEVSDRPAVDWILGGARVRAAKLGAARMALFLEERGELIEQQPLGCDLDFAFESATLVPASQDPEPGFETASAWLDRPRPAAIDLGQSPQRPLDLMVRETASAEASRVLRIQARNASSDSSVQFDSDVVVIDPTPLAICRVKDSLTLEKGALLAEYSDDSEAAPGWEFTAVTGEMTIILPPQSVGEEMIKGRLSGRPDAEGNPREVPERGKLFDYRLGANAALLVDRTDIDTARTAPPWMLRRHLNRRTGVTGLKLNGATFELVYGMTTTISAPGLRLAELDALIGRIPFADSLVGRLRERRELEFRATGSAGEDTPAQVQQAFAATQGRWILDLLNRPAWWPLFRDVGDRRQLKLHDDVAVEIRPARQTAHPFRLTQYATGRGEASGGGREPLRGGVDWLFQSPNIYGEFVHAPEAVEALVEGVAFGPLGAEGSQSAHFANGKTIVISRTRQGHLESLVLMRIGRIGMLWNHSRHVIVYQRSSRRAPRYGYWDDESAPLPDPDFEGDTYDRQRADFDGFMALRKVREYVEITQPRRTYPDIRPDRALSGPLLQSTFETTIIPVKASWATDIDRGQIIPLSGPVEPGERRFFPRPKIFLEFARAVEKGGGLIASEVPEPGQLFFFTSTRPEDGRDTDAWPAWPDVDYPLIPQPEPPKVDYRPNFTGAQRQPDAARADLGQSRFTIDLVPNEEAVNLMHGRQPNAVEARVMNVSLARGRPDVTLPQNALQMQVGKAFAETEGILGDQLTELRAFARAHAMSEADIGSPAHAQFIRDASALVGKANSLIRDGLRAKLFAEFGSDGGRFKETGDWVQLQAETASAYVANFASDMEAARQDIRTLRAELSGPGQALEEARTRAIATYEGLIRQTEQRLETFSAVPLQALEQLRETLRELEDEGIRFLQSGQARMFALVREIESAYWENSELAAALDARWRDGAGDVLDLIRKLSLEAAASVDAKLGPLFAAADVPGATSLHKALVDVLGTTIPSILDELEYRLDEVPPFDLGEPDWAEIASIPDLLWNEGRDRKWLQVAMAKPLAEFETAVAVIVGAIGTQLKAGRNQIRTAADEVLAKLRTGALDVINEQLEDAADRFAAWADRNAKLLTGPIEAALKDAAGNPALTQLAGDFKAAQHFVRLLDGAESPLIALERALTEGSIAGIAEGIEQAGRRLEDEFRRAARHAERAIVKDIEKQLEAAQRDLLKDAATPVLELGRALASGLDTDSLRSTRDALGYYYKEGLQELGVTRASAIFNDLGAGNLNALSAVVPFEKLRDRLLPELANLDFSTIFPDFAGLKLEHLFPELRIVKDELGKYDWLTVKHGFDKDRLTAWSDISIDKTFDDPPTLFAIPPVTLTLVNASLTAHCRMEIGADGQRVQDVSGSILADWALNLSGKPVVTMRRANLVFGNDGKFDFKFESENIELAQELKFITEALKNMLPQEEGLTITPALPAGIKAELSLPLPDIGTGAFTLTGITLSSHLGLTVAQGFKVTTGFWLSKPDRPFGLAVLFLGGGGWAGVDVSYTPPAIFETRVSIGVSAGAFVAINLGFARASAGLLFTAGIDFYRRSGGGRDSTSISLGLLIWGDFSILSIAHAYLRITARITYTSGGGMVAYGRVEVGIRISFFYTLRVRRDFERVFQKAKGADRAVAAPAFALALAAEAAAPPESRAAIDCHFTTLDLGFS